MENNTLLLTADGYTYRDPLCPELMNTSLWKRVAKEGGTGAGCGLNCIYCNQTFLSDTESPIPTDAAPVMYGIDGGTSVNLKMMVGNKVIYEASPDDVINEIKKSPFWVQDSGVIIGNMTDPGLNWAQSISMADRIRKEAGHTGPSIFITKMNISETNIEVMKRFKAEGGRPIVYVTYSGLPKEIEPAGARSRIEAMKKLHKAGIPVVCSMRPLIDGLNGTPENIERVVREVIGNVYGMTTGGLYVYPASQSDPGTLERFKVAGYPLSEIYSSQRYTVAKILPSHLRPLVRDIVEKVSSETGLSMRLQDHTTCIATEIMTKVYGVKDYHDRLAHWTTPDRGLVFDEQCQYRCLPEQILSCSKLLNGKILPSLINIAIKVLERMGHFDKKVSISEHQRGAMVVENGILTFPELATLIRETGLRFDNLPSEQGFKIRLEEAFKEAGVSIDKLKGYLNVGQNWYVFVDGANIDGTYNNYSLWRYARGRTLCRIPSIIDVNSVEDLDSLKELARRIGEQSKRPSEIEGITGYLKGVINII